MKLLVVGGGGREHALIWKLRASRLIKKIYCAPGNGGIGRIAQRVALDPSDISGLAAFARKNRIDLTVVGPELPLSLGIVDEFVRFGLSIFGPSKRAAEIETSKAFAKEFMLRHEIPTAGARILPADQAAAEAKRCRLPVVLKADGLASGKGVIIARIREEAAAGVQALLSLGKSSSKILFEEMLEGEEASFLVLTDGNKVLPLAEARDYKRVGESDSGPNTGGMGAYSPVRKIPKSVRDEVLETILRPAIRGLAKEGRPFLGILYAGVMLTFSGPKVLEFNARFGDPETQVILPRLAGELVEPLGASAAGKLGGIRLRWKKETALCVVIASGGYPGPFEKGISIRGLAGSGQLSQGDKEALVFHAGTELGETGWNTSGGRVLGITVLGEGIPAARERVYAACKRVEFSGMHYRSDIGK